MKVFTYILWKLLKYRVIQFSQKFPRSRLDGCVKFFACVSESRIFAKDTDDAEDADFVFCTTGNAIKAFIPLILLLVCVFWHKLESLCYIFYCLNRGMHGEHRERGIKRFFVTGLSLAKGNIRDTKHFPRPLCSPRTPRFRQPDNVARLGNRTYQGCCSTNC